MSNPVKLPPVLLEDPAMFLCGAVRGEQFNCLCYFPVRYGFGIIVLLNCAKCDADPARRDADVAQSAEHPPCKRAVTSSSLVVGSANG